MVSVLGVVFDTALGLVATFVCHEGYRYLPNKSSHEQCESLAQKTFDILISL